MLCLDSMEGKYDTSLIKDRKYCNSKITRVHSSIRKHLLGILLAYLAKLHPVVGEAMGQLKGS